MNATATLPPAALRWPAVRRVLLAAWQAQRRRWWLWLLLALALVLPAVGVWFKQGPMNKLWPVLAVLASMPLAFALVAGWLLLVFNVLLQNHPQLARNVPGQVAALRHTLLAAAGTVVATCGLLTALLGGPVLAVMSAGAVVCAALAAAQRWPLLWLLLLAPMWTSALWVKQAVGIQPQLQALWQAWAWPFTAATLLLAALALSRVVMTGGAAHVKAHARLQMLGAAMTGQFAAQGQRQEAPLLNNWGLRGARAWYDAHLRRLLARRDSPTLARLAMGMGPQAHWTGNLANNLLGIVLAMLFVAVTELFPNWQMGAAVRPGLALGLVVAAMALVVQLPAAIWASRREQALLRLLPQAPQGAALNRWLALRIGGLEVTTLLLELATLMALIAFYDIDQLWPQTSRIAIATIVMSTLLIPLMWRDWSKQRAPSGAGSLLVVVSIVVCIGVSVVWGVMLQWPWWALHLAVLVLLLLLLLWRWHALGRLPAAWPAGRRST